MEYRTRVTLYSTVLAVLTLTAVLGFVFSSQAVNQRSLSESLLGSGTTDAIALLSIEGKASLVKKDSGWQVLVSNKPYVASADRITGFLQTLSSLKKGRLVASGTDLAEFGLDKDFQRLQARDKSGKTLFDLLIGKADAQGKNVYVKFQDKNEIYETDRSFARSLELDFNTWTDLSLVLGSPKVDDLVRVVFNGTIVTKEKRTYKSFSLSRQIKDQKPHWQLDVDKSFPESADGFINQLVQFKANANLKPNEDFDAQKPVGTLTLEWAKGPKTEVVFGAPDAEGKYPVQVADRKLWINDWALDSILFGGKSPDPTPAPKVKK